jgi:GNAT superfamily N-acetyltransferase
MNSENKIQIVDFLPEHKKRFIEINEAWITKDFVMEELDHQELYNPEENILKGGGVILIALLNGEPVGTCALVKMDNDSYEMIKMGVDEKARGLKIGKLLGEAILARAKKMGAKKIILHSNTKFSGVAVELYYKLGFKKVPLGETEWQRADIRMEYSI